jgi:hypothetical protein
MTKKQAPIKKAQAPKTEKAARSIKAAESLEAMLNADKNKTKAPDPEPEQNIDTPAISEGAAETNQTPPEIIPGTETEVPAPEVMAEVKAETSNDPAPLTFMNDLDAPTIEDKTFKAGDAIKERAEGFINDDFATNDTGVNEQENDPAYQREMAKIKASTIVEFFDVVFMISCLFISKDYSDKSQAKFSLIESRKKAIKTNIYQILVASKKKQNPMAAVIFLVLFSYVPLLITAFMQRIKEKREKDREAKENQLRNAIDTARVIQMPQQPYQMQSYPGMPQAEVLNMPAKPVKAKQTGHIPARDSVRMQRNGLIKNSETNEVYDPNKRGRRPKWLTNYEGAFGKVA